MKKGLDGKFLHYGIRREDLELIKTTPCRNWDSAENATRRLRLRILSDIQ